MSLKRRLESIERRSRGGMVEIARHDGTVTRFPRSALKDAFFNLHARLGAGEEAPPEHPFLEAVRDSPDPRWRESLYMCEDPDAHANMVLEDLSEP